MRFWTLALLLLAAPVIALGDDLTHTTGTTPIIGVNSGDTSITGMPYQHHPERGLGVFTDGDTSTNDDTYGYGPSAGYPDSYFGFSFAAPTTDAITGLTVVFYLNNGDGGWFGENGTQPPVDPGPLATILVEPALQISTDGSNWTTVADTSDYLTVVGTHNNRSVSGLVTFTLATPVSGIEDIRLVGPSGGASNFVDVSEESVFGSAVPEPSTYGLMLGALILIVVVERRRTAVQS